MGLRALGLEGLKACGFQGLRGLMKQYLKYWCIPGYPGNPSNDPLDLPTCKSKELLQFSNVSSIGFTLLDNIRRERETEQPEGALNESNIMLLECT